MSTSRDPQGGEETEDAPVDAREDAEAVRERMRALARKRWDARDQEAARLRAVEDLAGSDGRVVLVRTPVEVGAIIRKLGHEAKQGDTAAARELRAWLSQFPPDDAAADASDLAAPQRARVAALLARLIAEDEEHLQTEGFEGGTQDGFDSPLPPQQVVQPTGHPRSDGSHRDERGSRPLTAKSTPPPHADAEDANEPLPADGTGQEVVTRGDLQQRFMDVHQMDVDECIAVAEEGSDGRA